VSLNIFWDTSNIWLVGRKVCTTIEPGNEDAFRVHILKLFDFVRSSVAAAKSFVLWWPGTGIGRGHRVDNT